MASTAAVTTTTQTSSTAATDSKIKFSASRLADSEDSFLKLLTVQLKNQDPLSPMDTNEFTQQLVQLTGVEQQLLTNDLLNKLVGSSGDGLSNAVGLIGKSAIATSDLATLDAGKAVWNYRIEGAPSDVLLSVQNSQGQTIWTGKPSTLAGGDQTFTWDGVNSSGRQLPSGGVYSMKVTAKDVSGGALSSSTSLRGVVSGVQTVDGAIQVSIGKTLVPLSSIVSVVTPTTTP